MILSSGDSVQPQVVQAILQRESVDPLIEDAFGRSQVLIAACNGDIDILRLLVARVQHQDPNAAIGAMIMARDYWGKTAMNYAGTT